MPRYSYSCSSCEEVFVIFHSMGDTASLCPKCQGEVSRIPSSNFTFTSSVKKEEQDVGDRVNRHIEDAKKELEKTKKHSRRDYE